MRGYFSWSHIHVIKVVESGSKSCAEHSRSLPLIRNRVSIDCFQIKIPYQQMVLAISSHFRYKETMYERERWFLSILKTEPPSLSNGHISRKCVSMTVPDLILRLLILSTQVQQPHQRLNLAKESFSSMLETK